MKIKKELLKRQVGGESFLVPLGKTVYDSNGLFVLFLVVLYQEWGVV